MTVGMKVQKMLHEDAMDTPELQEEARRRKEISDGILELIYQRIMTKQKRKDGMT